MKRALLALALTPVLLCGQRAENPEIGSLNKPERLEWFRDLGFGLFIHWSVDSQTRRGDLALDGRGVGRLQQRFFNDLPKTFNPRKFYPQDWAALAKLAGIKYVVFTTKHHSGFAMWDTKTTAVRHHEHAVQARHHARDSGGVPRAGHRAGHLLLAGRLLVARDRTKIDVQRNIPEVQPGNNPGLMKLTWTRCAS